MDKSQKHKGTEERHDAPEEMRDRDANVVTHSERPEEDAEGSRVVQSLDRYEPYRDDDNDGMEHSRDVADRSTEVTERKGNRDETEGNEESVDENLEEAAPDSDEDREVNHG